MDKWEDCLINDMNSVTAKDVQPDKLAQMREAASGLVDRLSDSTMTMPRMTGHTDEEKVLFALREKSTCTQTWLLRRLRTIQAHDLHEIIARLHEEGRVLLFKQDSGGRPRVLIQLVHGDGRVDPVIPAQPRTMVSARERILAALGRRTCSTSELLTTTRLRSNVVREVLRQLVDDGIVSSATESSGGRPRVVHRLTDNPLAMAGNSG